jgi:hypothetical protein
MNFTGLTFRASFILLVFAAGPFAVYPDPRSGSQSTCIVGIAFSRSESRDMLHRDSRIVWPCGGHGSFERAAGQLDGHAQRDIKVGAPPDQNQEAAVTSDCDETLDQPPSHSSPSRAEHGPRSESPQNISISSPSLLRPLDRSPPLTHA